MHLGIEPLSDFDLGVFLGAPVCTADEITAGKGASHQLFDSAPGEAFSLSEISASVEPVNRGVRGVDVGKRLYEEAKDLLSEKWGVSITIRSAPGQWFGISKIEPDEEHSALLRAALVSDGPILVFPMADLAALQIHEAAPE